MFGLFRKAPDLKRAIASVNAERTARNQEALERALKGSVLFLAAPDMPKKWNGTTILAEEVSIPILTSDAPGGGTALLCFTDAGEVQRRTGSESCFGLEFRDVCALVVRHGYAGIIVNPQGPWAGLPAYRLRDLANAL